MAYKLNEYTGDTRVVGEIGVRYSALKPMAQPSKPWLQDVYCDGSYPDDQSQQGVTRIMRLHTDEAMTLLGIHTHPHAGVVLNRFTNKYFTIVAEGYDGYRAVYLHDYKFYLMHIPFDCDFGRDFANKSSNADRIVLMSNDPHF